MKIININYKQAKALGHKKRWKIFHLLSKELTVEQLAKLMNDKTFRTALRHHLNILLKAELVMMTRMIPKNGSHLKYYKAMVKINE
jgi:DNA-binding transcriptional ArsR family regulator